MQDRTRIEARWGLQTGVSIGVIFGAIALVEFWIAPQEYQRHVALAPVATLAIFLVAGVLAGGALAAFRHMARTRTAAAVMTFVASLPLSAGALASSHGRAYLERSAHWLVIGGIALAAPAVASMLWSDGE